MKGCLFKSCNGLCGDSVEINGMCNYHSKKICSICGTRTAVKACTNIKDSVSDWLSIHCGNYLCSECKCKC